MTEAVQPHSRRKVAAVLTLVTCLAGCSPPVSPREKTVPAMGTYLSVTVPADDDGSALAMASYLAEGVAERIQKLVDESDPSSTLAKLNDVAYSIRMATPEDVYRLLRLAQQYTEQTAGAYDISTVPLEESWGFGHAPLPAAPLSEPFLQAAMVGVGARHIRLHANRLVSFTSPRTRIRVTNLARSYAVDLSVRDIREKGIAHALLNLGGHCMRALGQAGLATSWKVPVFNPMERGAVLGEVELSGGTALASRHRLEDFVTIAGARYSRILDPRTGRPAEGTAGVFVLGPTATEAHALATALMVLGVEEASLALREFPRCSALLVPEKKPVELWMWGAFDRAFAILPAYREAIRYLTAPPPAQEDEPPGTDGSVPVPPPRTDAP